MQVGGRAVPKCTIKRGRPPASLPRPDVVAKQGEPALSSQCVPTDAALWDTTRYRDFLALRREQLAERMNAFIKEKAGL